MTTGSLITKYGAVPTPSKIVRLITHLLIEHWEEHKKTVSNVKELNVLDPAVGDGRFLVQFLEDFSEKSKNKTWDENLFCYGLDINKTAIQAATNNISKIMFNFPEISLKVGNALLGFVEPPSDWVSEISGNKLNDIFVTANNIEKTEFQKIKSPFHWFREWPAVIENGGFDIILGNPPYGIDLTHEEKTLFRLLYHAIDPEVESYLLFIERSIQLVRESGFIGFIIPSNIATNLHYQKIRKLILERTKILRFVNLNRQIFPNIHVETCILILQRSSSQLECKNHNIHFERLAEISYPPYNFLDEQIITQKQVSMNPYQMFLPTPNTETSGILNNIQKDSVPLSELAYISRGIELGFTHPLTSDRKTNPDFVPLIAGRSIRRFRIHNKIRYIKFDHENKSIFKDYNHYIKSKIMVRRIGHKLIAAFDKRKHFCVCDVYIIRLKSFQSESEYLYLEALLNSALVSFYFKKHFTSLKNIFPKIPIKYLKEIPVKLPSNNEKITYIVNELHGLPWDIQGAKSHHLNLLNDLDQEIFEIYGMTRQEQSLITRTLNEH
ncbi:MAG: N-6 DNA methylase [Candidatus Heimdallarchaeota archaeon]|nr:MAG: N-6 DNA methylase [Candidatus Heimdallarchaeota archaeon]